MKNVVPLLILTIICFYSCKKDSKASNTNGGPALSGTYKLFRITDTTFINLNKKDGVLSITNAGELGDTAYYNINMPDSIVEPNWIPEYNPSNYLNRILNFSSSSSGTETDYGETPREFTYSLSAKQFVYVGNSFSYTIYQINSTTIALLFFNLNNGNVGSTIGDYYKKQ